MVMYQKMSSHPDLADLPAGHPAADGPESLKAFLKEHGSTFLKPTEGSQGKGIVRVRRIKGMYEWRRGQTDPPDLPLRRPLPGHRPHPKTKALHHAARPPLGKPAGLAL